RAPQDAREGHRGEDLPALCDDRLRPLVYASDDPLFERRPSSAGFAGATILGEVAEGASTAPSDELVAPTQQDPAVLAMVEGEPCGRRLLHLPHAVEDEAARVHARRKDIDLAAGREMRDEPLVDAHGDVRRDLAHGRGGGGAAIVRAPTSTHDSV